MAGFDAGTSLEAVKRLVSAWARTVSALRVEVERFSVFPPPAQIAIAQIRKTPELSSALVDLRHRAADQKLAISTSISAPEWIFHLSIAYCSRLTEAAWRGLAEYVQSLGTQSAHCVVTS